MLHIKIIDIFLKHILSKLSEELKNDIQILIGQAVFKFRIKTLKNIVLINSSKTADSTYILMLFLNSLYNLL